MTTTAVFTGNNTLLALGLMSGTSIDGVDAALIMTDGERNVNMLGSLTLPYDIIFREQIRTVIASKVYTDKIRSIEHALTLKHVKAVKSLLAREGKLASEIDIIGFHGQTLFHQPKIGKTWQIGDAALLAAETGIDVVADFRSADVAAGGEGAPLTPVFHLALSQDLKRPLAILNLGGVANVTWIGMDDVLMSFDTGPGNALLDDWVREKDGRPYDAQGKLASIGNVNEDVLAELLSHSYFNRPVPKSMDRGEIDPKPAQHLSTSDGAATLTAFSAAAVAQSTKHFPKPPKQWIIAGGGRHNPILVAALADRLEAPVSVAESVGWDGDALEALAFAYLAVRSLRNLPLTFPSTTGVERPTCGGQFFTRKS